jgi:hypothetical protein
MYLTHLKHGSTFFLPLDAKLNAEIVFDLPSGSDKPGQTRCNSKQFKWGVGLILKSGDQNEYPDDQLMGPTCQFFNGGSINFHGTDYCRPGADLQDLSTCPQEVPGGTYKYVGTTFSMSLSLWRNLEEIDLPPLSGNATFSLNRPGKTEVYSGDLLMQDRRLKMEDGITPVPYYDIDWVRALGVSLVCAQNDLTDMSIRLKRFTVSVTPRP